MIFIKLGQKALNPVIMIKIYKIMNKIVIKYKKLKEIKKFLKIMN
jgi:hypothetical protein